MGNERKEATFALVTPSYYVDVEYCRWLCETVDRFVPEHVRHYILVDRADRELFAPFASSRRTVVHKEDLLAGRLHQVPFARRWWVGKRSPPVRGWIVQQLTKLLIHEVAREDVLVFVDSGVFFVRSWDPRDRLRGSLVPLFRERGEFFRRSRATQRWHRTAARMLGVKPSSGYDVGYVNPLVTWRRDNLVMLHRHIERVTARPSFDSLVWPLTLSEYHLYGMYCDEILGDRAGHYHHDESQTLCHWTAENLGTQAVRERLREQLHESHVIVMINEKSRTSLDDVRSAFADL
jgi:hypothetical protein